MFDIGFPEFFLAAVVALLVLGPERLPSALRTLGLWIGRLRRSYYNVKTEIEREIGMDEVRRQLHNEQVMADVQRVEREVRALGDDIGGQPTSDPSPTIEAAERTAGTDVSPAPSIAEPPASSSLADAHADEPAQIERRTASD